MSEPPQYPGPAPDPGQQPYQPPQYPQQPPPYPQPQYPQQPPPYPQPQYPQQPPPYPQQPYQPLPSYPTEGYAVPEVAPGGDPLVSPDYNCWWQRTMAIVKASWKELLTLQLIGAVFVLILRGPTAIYQQITTRDFTNTAAGSS